MSFLWCPFLKQHTHHLQHRNRVSAGMYICRAFSSWCFWKDPGSLPCCSTPSSPFVWAFCWGLGGQPGCWQLSYPTDRRSCTTWWSFWQLDTTAPSMLETLNSLPLSSWEAGWQPCWAVESIVIRHLSTQWRQSIPVSFLQKSMCLQVQGHALLVGKDYNNSGGPLGLQVVEEFLWSSDTLQSSPSSPKWWKESLVMSGLPEFNNVSTRGM